MINLLSIIERFLIDFYLLSLASNKRYLINNLINFFIVHIDRKRKKQFYFIFESNKLNLNGLINTLYDKYYKQFILIGKLLTDANLYSKIHTKYKNKIVLDIGAWIGDSILLFHRLGVKKIIAYEPIKENVEFANKIIEKFKINCKLFPYAVCENDGIVSFIIEESEYRKADLSLFEEKVKNPKIIKVKCISWEKVLENAIKEGVNIVKIDCEGCEKFLTKVNDELIKKIPEWIIECHDLEIAREIYNKFVKCGFRLKKIIMINQKTFLFYFSFF